jgi:two-component system phosphate regulon sensor histidine kinase PhoR
LARFWIRAALAVAALAALALGVAAAAGANWGWAAFSGGLLLIGAHHLRHLVRLIRWARAPLGTPVPPASGIWSWAFAALSRRSRTATEARQQLTENLERFLDAAQAMPDGVVILSRSNAIEWLNAAAERQFGLDAERDLGSPVTNMVRQPEFVAYLEAADFREPLAMRAVRGEPRTYSVHLIAFGAGRKLVLSRDISHLERLETMRRDFVANVSHELKTPLTVVRGFVETVLDGLHDMEPAEAEHYLTLAEEQAARMQRLVDDLLTLSELETGSPPPLDERVDVQSLIAELAAEAEALSAGRHVLRVDPGEPAALIGSAREIRSAFANLVSNAIRYTPDGGTVAMSWSATPEGGGEFAVADSGIGIEARHIPRLTERFYRVDRGRSRESGGTGLGLAIVKHVLSRHQAVLDIRSEPGKGSRFTARFPPKRLREIAAAAPWRPSAAPRN